MKKATVSVSLFAVVILGVGLLMPNIVFAECVGTYYAKEFAHGRGKPATGYSLWTFSNDGAVVSSSNGEPSVPFSTAQGNYWAIGYKAIKSTTFDFSGPNPNPAYPNVSRVEAVFQFKNNCNGTVAGKSKFSVISCPVSEGPLCAPGFPVVTDQAIELMRISSH